MTVRQPRYSTEEHARRGVDRYEREVRPEVEAGNEGKIVALDIDTGAFEVAEDTVTACERLLAHCPDAQIWCVRIGHRAVHRFSSRVATKMEMLMSYRKMQCLAILLSTVALGIAADKPKEDAVKEELKKLQGTWQVTKFIDHSEETAPADEIKHMTFKFKEDHLTIQKDKDDSGKELRFTLNPSKKPKWIDIDTGTRISEGVYKLDGDELTICVVAGTRNGKAAPRPSEFKARKREKYTLFVVKKVKK